MSDPVNILDLHYFYYSIIFGILNNFYHFLTYCILSDRVKFSHCLTGCPFVVHNLILSPITHPKHLTRMIRKEKKASNYTEKLFFSFSFPYLIIQKKTKFIDFLGRDKIRVYMRLMTTKRKIWKTIKTLWLKLQICSLQRVIIAKLHLVHNFGKCFPVFQSYYKYGNP